VYKSELEAVVETVLFGANNLIGFNKTQRDDDIKVYLQLSGGQKTEGWTGKAAELAWTVWRRQKKSLACAGNRATLKRQRVFPSHQLCVCVCINSHAQYQAFAIFLGLFINTNNSGH